MIQSDTLELTLKTLQHPVVIAVDGPAASGKGTLARRIAEHFKWRYMDTGKLYRAVGYRVLQQGHTLEQHDKAVDIANKLCLSDLDEPSLFQEDVGAAASVVSAIPEVRQALLAFQRDFGAQPGGAVLDGRDIGTVVCPDADIKLFITASLENRAQRRHKELVSKGINVSYEQTLTDLETRDKRDKGRSVAPLIAAKDAFHLDTTDLDADEVFKRVALLVKTCLERMYGK